MIRDVMILYKNFLKKIYEMRFYPWQQVRFFPAAMGEWFWGAVDYPGKTNTMSAAALVIRKTHQ
jgi:hypothetical protein